MKIFIKGLRKNAGFTLVELMVVVAIIGLLSAVAIPNFRKYQAKSKTSEAKLQLAALYSAQTSFYTDFDYYATCLNLMGFDPSNEITTRYFAIGHGAAFAGTLAVANGAPAGCTAGASTIDAVLSASTDGYRAYGASKSFNGSSSSAAAVQAGYTVAANSFTAGANGIVDKSYSAATTSAEFSINNLKFIRQVRAGY